MKHGEVIRIMSIDSGKLQNQLVKNGDYNNRVYADGSQKKWTAQYNATMGDSLWLRHINKECDGKVIKTKSNKIIDKDGNKVERDILFTDSIVQVSFDSSYTELDVDEDTGEEKVETKVYTNKKNNKIEVVNKSKRKTVNTASGLREIFYDSNTDISINNKKYVMDIRSSSMSREGDCLFIRKPLHKKMEDWCRLGITLKSEYNIATVRAYESLAKSDICGTITISPDQILLIDDEKFGYITNASVTTIDENDIDEEGRRKLITQTVENYKGKSDIWDGQSLLDSKYYHPENVLDKDGNVIEVLPPKGAMLLRGKWFKTAAFSCGLQQYFADNYKDENGNPIKVIKDMFGRELNVDRIVMITTPNSMKILKMVDLSDQFNDADNPKCACYEYWLKDLENEDGIFGIVKSESKSKLFDGKVQQMTYQVINSLPITRTQFEKLMEYDMEYVYKLRTDNNELFKYITSNSIDFNSSLFQMFLTTHPDMVNTYEFKAQRTKQIGYYTDDIRAGKIKVLDSDYCWLLGNPYEMLWYSIRQCQEVNREDMTHPLTGWQTYIKKYEDGKELAGFRNPHISSGNICHFTNTHSDLIDKYFNLSDNIAVVNSIGIDIMPRLGGMDFDSDSANFVPDPIITDIAKWCLENCPTPICDIPVPPNADKPTAEKMAEIDNLISQNKIGTICNRSQEFLSYWNDRRNNLLDRKERDRLIASGEIVLTDEELISYVPVTEKEEQECKEYMQKYYDINSALSSLCSLEIDKPKKFIDITDVFERFIEEISDWEELDLYEPEIEYVRVNTFTDKHKVILEEHELNSLDEQSVVKLQEILDTVQPLMYLKEEELTEEQKVLRIEFSDFFKENIKRIRPMFMGDLTKKKKEHNSFSYRTFNTAMDWVAPIVKSIKRADRSDNNTTKHLVELMDKRRLKDGEHNKITKLCSLAEEYYNRYKLANSKRNFWSYAQTTKDGFIIELQNYEMSCDTIYHIIKKVYTDNPKYRNFLLKSLCQARMNDVVHCFRRIANSNTWDNMTSEQRKEYVAKKKSAKK